MDVWAKRLAVSLLFAALAAIAIWVLGVLMLLLAGWLSTVIPSGPILLLAGILFVGLVVGDWAYDWRRRRTGRPGGRETDL